MAMLPVPAASASPAMQTHDTRPAGFQPATSAPKAKPPTPPSFEVVEPGRGNVNPFPPRPHEVWTAEPPSAPPVTVPLAVQAQVEPENQNIGLFWKEFRMNAPGTPPAPLPNIGNGGTLPVIQRDPVTPEPYWYKGHPAQSAEPTAPPGDAQRAEPATQAMTPPVQRQTTGETETAQGPKGDHYNWIESHFRMNAPDIPSPPPLAQPARVAAVQSAPVTLESYWYQGPPVQAKLTVGAPNDVYEQEADRVAEQVMSMAPPTTPNIQRQAEEEQEAVQTKALVETITPLVQRQEALEDEPIQAKCESCEEEAQVQRSLNGVPQVQADLENRLNASKGGGSPLPDDVRSFMEPRFTANLKDVRVHTDNTAIQMNRELNAQAFTYRKDIYFGQGKAPAKDELTAHELTHVIQQTGLVQCQTVPAGGDPQCPTLLGQIRRFLFGDQNTKGLIQRWEELRADPQNLQWDFWSNPHPQYGSVEGHQQQFRNMQQGLRNRLNDWNSRNCDDPDGPSQLPRDVWDWSTRPAPVPIPRPRPVPSSPRSVSVSDVIEVLVTLGLSIALVAVVIAALADPEPASKLALAGLSVGMITLLLTRFGIQSDSGA